MWIDVIVGVTYATTATCARYLLSPDFFQNSFTGAYYAWYTYVILPFNVVVLTSVVFDCKTEYTLPAFYASRYLDYVSTIEILRKKQHNMFGLDVFHNSTVPILIRLGWEDKLFLRFIVFMTGIAVSTYYASQNTNILSDNIKDITVVQWTQYIVVLLHTVRTSSRFKRMLFLVYVGIFTGLILQFFLL
jgi:hypothetical protein